MSNVDQDGSGTSPQFAAISFPTTGATGHAPLSSCGLVGRKSTFRRVPSSRHANSREFLIRRLTVREPADQAPLLSRDTRTWNTLPPRERNAVANCKSRRDDDGIAASPDNGVMFVEREITGTIVLGVKTLTDHGSEVEQVVAQSSNPCPSIRFLHDGQKAEAQFMHALCPGRACHTLATTRRVAGTVNATLE